MPFLSGPRRPSRPRCQGRVGFAFIGAKRRPLTEEAGGLGAVFTQEGQTGEKTVPLGTYRWKSRFCKCGETGVDGVLQEEIKFSTGEEAPGQQRAETVLVLRR